MDQAMFHAQVMSQLEETEDWLRWCDECNERISILRDKHERESETLGRGTSDRPEVH